MKRAVIAAIVIVGLLVGIAGGAALSMFSGGGEALPAAPASPTACVAPGATTTVTSADFDTEQLDNAATIISVGARLKGVGTAGEIVAVDVAIAESQLLNLANDDSPESQTLTTEGSGHNYDSLGLFQQRPSQGWGTPPDRVKTIMDPALSAGFFYKALLAVPDWRHVPPYVAAQEVQRSGIPDAYIPPAAAAARLVAEIKPGTVIAPPSNCVPGTPVPLNPKAGLPADVVAQIAEAPEQVQEAIAYALSKIGDKYVFGATGPDEFDCSGLNLEAYGSAGVSLPRTTYQQIDVGTPVTEADLLPGDDVYPDPDHVQIYLGDGYIVEAPHTGAFVRVVKMWGFWQARRVVPAIPPDDTLTSKTKGGPGWITRSGSNLMLNGHRFRYVGWGGFQWWGGCGNANPTPSQLNQFFAQMRPGSVFRMHEAASAPASGIAAVIAAAARHGQHVIVTLLDFNGQCGSPYGQLAGNPGFFDPGGHNAWKNWVGNLVATYKHNPTVMAWEIINEPNFSQIGPERALDFYREMSGYIKQVDPNHLIETGSYGPYASGGEYEAVNRLANIDIADDHDYNHADGPIQNAVQDANLTAGKPLIIGEFDEDFDGVHDLSFWGPPSSDPLGMRSITEAFQQVPVLAGVNAWAWDTTQIGSYENQDVNAAVIP